jgi:hypothetical protein
MLLDIGRRLDLFPGDRDPQLVGADLDPAEPSGTKVKWRPIKPSLTVANWGSSVSTST